MCYAHPGPRCSSHALATLTRARVEHADALDAGDSERITVTRDHLRRARQDYFSTPAGQTYLNDAINRASGNDSLVRKLTQVRDRCADLRASQIAAMRAEGVEFSEEGAVQRCQMCGQFTGSEGDHECPGRRVDAQLDNEVTGTHGRTDVHRPSSLSFDPEHYRVMVVGDTDAADSPFDVRALREAAQRLRDQGYRIGSGSRNQCGHCGARMRYVALMAREDVKEYIYVGEQCLDNRFDDTREEFQQRRTRARLNSERRAKDERIANLVEQHPALAWLTYPSQTHDWMSSFTDDIGGQLRSNGRLSERQIAAVERAIAKDTERYERQQQILRQRAAERATASPVPLGAVNIQGEVVSIKTEQREVGYRRTETFKKMMVRGSAGWRVWVTVPSNIREVERGQFVSLRATVSPSADDETFGYGSRPRNGMIIEDPTA